jgi:two-component system, response regulator RegA
MNHASPPLAATNGNKVERLLVCDDDQIFRTRLVRALQTRGFDPLVAQNAEEAIILAKRHKPDRAIVDMRMPGMSGLDLLSHLIEINGEMQVVILTGYGSIANAVEATKRGARDYLTKPVDTEQILASFEREAEVPVAEAETSSAEGTPSLARVEWEHIQRILSDCGGNISQAARKLGIHRRSLQRKLQKLPPLE